MRVLIVEDDDEKAQRLRDFMEETFRTAQMSITRSLQSGLHAIKESTPDLILLDMTMRNYDRTLVEDGGRPHAFAGREILRQMRRERIDVPVIIVTHFDRFGEEDDFVTLEELAAELKERFPNYLGTVQFKSNVDDWKPSLAALVDQRGGERKNEPC